MYVVNPWLVDNRTSRLRLQAEFMCQFFFSVNQ